ncbi:MAG TPA: Sec-independent protein translocase protein TatB [Candidatus Polarisedimenticolaceae bacterium]|nr:Sec-independent protein translocase protein TatB [Candidatus Polarisedimenticolaceae bacterium]
MFGSLGGAELLLILVLALLLFGPRRLPEIGRTIGRGMSEFRKATSEFKSNLEREVDLSEIRKTREGLADVRSAVGQAIDDGKRFAVPRSADPPGDSRRGRAEGPAADTVDDEPRTDD